MLETYELENGQRPTYGASTYHIDLALYEVTNGRLTVSALAQSILDYGGHGNISFDLAPYRLNTREVAIGVRTGYMHQGLGGSHLFLLRREDKTFRKVFERQMEKFYDVIQSAPAGEPSKLASVLQVVARPGGMNDFRIVTRAYGWGDVGEPDETRVLRTTTDLWRWNGKTSRYELSR